jgi:uncharacterized membrane protein YheB (UPF0754 family)
MYRMPWQFFLIPVSSAFACWLFARLFFTFLFRPSKAKSFVGIKVQGLLPLKQPALAELIGKLVATEFLSMKFIEEKIADPANVQKIMPVIEEHIDDFLRNKLKKEMPVVGMLIGDKTIGSLKKVFIGELETMFPVIMKNYAGNLINDLNLEKLVRDKILTVSIPNLEQGFHTKLSKELRGIHMMALLLGLIIGLITMTIFFYTL